MIELIRSLIENLVYAWFAFIFIFYIVYAIVEYKKIDSHPFNVKRCNRANLKIYASYYGLQTKWYWTKGKIRKKIVDRVNGVMRR